MIALMMTDFREIPTFSFPSQDCWAIELHLVDIRLAKINMPEGPSLDILPPFSGHLASTTDPEEPQSYLSTE